MNFIKKLQIENNELKEKAQKAKDDIIDIEKYLTSKKFNCGDPLDGYVNVHDVIDRLRDLRLTLM